MNDITKDTVFVCPRCKAKYTADQWDSFTQFSSMTREQRRAFKSIVYVKTHSTHKKDYYYKCPECEEFSRITNILTEEQIAKREEEEKRIESIKQESKETRIAQAKPLLDLNDLEDEALELGNYSEENRKLQEEENEMELQEDNILTEEDLEDIDEDDIINISDE